MQHAHHIFRFGGTRETREAAQVAEQHRDLPTVRVEQPVLARGDDQFGDLRRQEPAQTVEPVELCHLFLDARASSWAFHSLSSAACAAIVV